MPTLYIIQGFLASGKTTFSTALAKTCGAVHLNADQACLASFSSVQLQANWEHCYNLTTTKLSEKAQSLLNEGRDVILDFGFWSRASRDNARHIATRANAQFVHYYLPVSDTVIRERLSQRSGPYR